MCFLCVVCLPTNEYAMVETKLSVLSYTCYDLPLGPLLTLHEAYYEAFILHLLSPLYIKQLRGLECDSFISRLLVPNTVLNPQLGICLLNKPLHRSSKIVIYVKIVYLFQSQITVQTRSPKITELSGNRARREHKPLDCQSNICTP